VRLRGGPSICEAALGRGMRGRGRAGEAPGRCLREVPLGLLGG